MSFKDRKRDDHGHVIGNGEVDGQECKHVNGSSVKQDEFDDDYEEEFNEPDEEYNREMKKAQEENAKKSLDLQDAINLADDDVLDEQFGEDTPERKLVGAIKEQSTEMSEYDDEDPNWDPAKDEHYSAYDNRVRKGNYSDDEINAAVQLAEEYGKNATRGIISFEQMKDVAEKMGLSNLSDRDLRLAWNKYNDILGRESFKGGSMKRWKKFGDAQSAFAEVINQEARKRKESGNYFPYDESDIEKAKSKILDIIRPHEGYDLDSSQAYMTRNELSQIEDIADKYHISDEDLRKLHNILNPDTSGYRVKGWQPPVQERISKEMMNSLKMPGDVVESFLKDLPKEKMEILEEWLLNTKRM